MSDPVLKAPFPAFGGKSAIADFVWSRLGDPRNYIEPFAFSSAVLLRRPEPGAIETINDRNSYVANFWRAVQHDPDAVAVHADWPVNESDCHARHRWLVNSDRATAALKKVREDPDAFDAKIAGWWCWGACMWIGSGWCDEGKGNSAQVPHLGDGGQMDHLPAATVSEQIPHLDAGGRMVHSPPADATVTNPGERRPAISRRGGGVTSANVTTPKKLPHLDASGRGDAASGPTGNRRPQIFRGRGDASTAAPVPMDGRASGAGQLRGVNKRPHIASGRGVASSAELSQQLPRLTGCNGDAVAPAPESVPKKKRAKRPQLCNGNTTAGPGVLSKTPATLDDNHRPQLADAFSRGRGVHGHDTLSACEARRLWLTDWMRRLSDRLRPVRICCGHWARVCDSPSTLTRLGTTGVFLDPPYRTHLADGTANRAAHIYANDKAQNIGELCDEVQAWCLKWGNDPEIKIILCGLDGEYPEIDAAGWEKVAWKSRGGYGNRSEKGKANAARERLWISPHCKPGRDDPTLFGAEAQGVRA